MLNNPVDISRLKKIKYCHWSKRETAWIAPMFHNNLEIIRNWFEGRVASFTVLDNKPVIAPKEKQRQPGIIYPINEPFLEKAREEMILKGMSPSTLKTYLNELGRFFGDIKQVSAIEFTHERLRNTWLGALKRLN